MNLLEHCRQELEKYREEVRIRGEARHFTIDTEARAKSKADLYHVRHLDLLIDRLSEEIGKHG